MRTELFFSALLFLPEARSDVLHFATCPYAIEPLVGSGLRERSQMSNVWTNLNVVEMPAVHEGRDAQPTAIPRHLVARIALADVLRQCIYCIGLGIAPHQGYAGDVAAKLADEVINGGFVERFADVLGQIRAMAARTMARTARDIHGERRLVRYFLKDDACIHVFQHD